MFENKTALRMFESKRREVTGCWGKLQNLPLSYTLIKTKKLHGLSPRANYTDRATATCRRSECQLLRIKGATWSA
jgi:hypothetical protein